MVGPGLGSAVGSSGRTLAAALVVLMGAIPAPPSLAATTVPVHAAGRPSRAATAMVEEIGRVRDMAPGRAKVGRGATETEPRGVGVAPVGRPKPPRFPSNG